MQTLLGGGGVAEREHEVFISHATEGKDEVVRPLANALHDYGLVVWFDEFVLLSAIVSAALRRR